jgi:23S rRNA (uracil1939-C5)-methyltransferase
MSRNPLLHRLGSWQLRQSAGSFFQACPPWAWTAFSSLMRGWEVGGKRLFDLYGGVGFFSAMLAGSFESFILVEGSEIAANDAHANLAGLSVRIINDDVDGWLPASAGSAGDVILLDPPRTGLTERMAERLLSADAKSIVLIGCDGAAFCRDAKRLAERWNLKNLAVIDLFPYSLQAEFVGLFVQNA